MQRADLSILTPFTAPDSEIERLLCQLMAEALDLDVVGVTDDFFQLGGDSLSAENFFLAIEEATDRRLPLSLLFERSTAKRLAEIVTTGDDMPSWSPLVKIRDRGRKPPIFLVPGVGGEVIGMGPLARHLDGDRPVYCCHFTGLDPSQKPFESIEDIAAGFLSEIRRVQPVGPYHLLGACFGGLVALEMAQRLRAEGEKVGLLCLADTPMPDVEAAGKAIGIPTGIQFFVDRVKFFAQDLTSRRRGERLKFLRNKAHRVASVIRSGSLPYETREEIAKRRVIEANHAAGRRYVPRPYDGATLYVRSRDRPSGPSQARRGLWQAYFPAGLVVHTVACSDSGALFNRHASELAAILATALHDSIPAVVER